MFAKTQVSFKESAYVVNASQGLLQTETVFFSGNTNAHYSSDKESLKILARQINGGDLPVSNKDAQHKLLDSLGYSTQW